MNHKIWNITIGTERANRMVDYTGMTRVLDNGKEATIIRFGDFYDIDVQLCTGEISTHKAYMDFQRCDSAALGFKQEQVEEIKPAVLYLLNK